MIINLILINTIFTIFINYITYNDYIILNIYGYILRFIWLFIKENLELVSITTLTTLFGQNIEFVQKKISLKLL